MRTKKRGKFKHVSGIFENLKDHNRIYDKYSHLYDLCVYQAKHTMYRPGCRLRLSKKINYDLILFVCCNWFIKLYLSLLHIDTYNRPIANMILYKIENCK